VVDHLQGVENAEPIYSHVRRQDFHSSGSRSLPENLKVEDLLLGVQEGNSTSEDRAKCQDSPDGSSDVDGKTNRAA